MAYNMIILYNVVVIILIDNTFPDLNYSKQRLKMKLTIIKLNLNCMNLVIIESVK